LKYITIDTGTTNTRVRCVEENNILVEYKSNIGVRNSAINGCNEVLKQCIREGIDYCINKLCIKIEDIEKIIASGMITSNVGLIEIPHLGTPVSVNKLRQNIVVKTFNDIVEKPIYFIPGVKNMTDDSDFFENIDIMRGEETEAFGALELSGLSGDTIYISPGSHTKFVFIDKNKRILECSTTLAGELLWALAKETILAESIPKTLISSIDEEYIVKGIETVKKYGFTKTCFIVRVVDKFTDSSPNQCANFIAGAICYHDILSIKSKLNGKHNILIGGSKILKELYEKIFELIDYDMNLVFTVRDDDMDMVTSSAGIAIVEGG
jgi:2-dehydro-3-deoxygalactonokinase